MEPDVDDDTLQHILFLMHSLFSFFLSDCGILEEDDKTIIKKGEETK